MLHDAAVVAGKDLRLEARARVSLNQVTPFALLVLVVFAFALDSDRGTLARVGPGLFWVTVLFSGLLAIQRSFVIESDDDARYLVLHPSISALLSSHEAPLPWSSLRALNFVV